MKRWKKMLVSLLTICMISSLSVVNVLAEGDAYSYKVTLSAGNKGEIAENAVVENLAYGSTVSFDISKVQVTDDKYYVKGIRLSGRDNEDALAAPAFTVTGDADYVVAYGIKGDMVAYTVNYQDANGNELAPSSTFYGNVGDKPVVAYQYIENFVPDALAMTKTLSKNEAENVFTFVYHPGDAGTVVENVTTTTITTVVPGTATPGTTGGTGTAGTAGTGAAGTAGAGAEGAAGGEAEAPNPETVESPDEDTPQSLVDLDDEETPKADVKVDKEELGKSMPLVGQIAIIAAAVIALIVLIVFLRKRAK